MWIFIFILLQQSNTFFFSQQSYMIPHPEKVQKGGEDAYYSDSQILVVSDGVGGWIEYGIDAGLYSKKLCKLIAQEFPKNKSYYTENPQKLIKYGQANNFQNGSATLVILTIDSKKPLVYTSLIGDSGYVILRFNETLKVIYDSPEQQHRFNFPYQLASPNQHFSDSPDSALNKIHEIQQNDIIIAGSDGLFDNIHLAELVVHVQQQFNQETMKLQNKKQLAQKLAQIAIKYGQDQTYVSPFSVNAKKLNYRYIGGKLDDTTVIVSQIQKQQNSQL